MANLMRREQEGVVELVLDRPHRSNAIDPLMLDGLIEELRSGLGPVALLSAQGDGAFCGGADTSLPDEDRARLSSRLYSLYEEMITSETVLICVLTGAAVGAGAQLAAACDLRVASPEAFLRFAGPGHGLAVGTWALGSLVGRGRAADLCLTMRDVDAREAHAIGLVDRLSAQPREEALAMARSICDLDTGARPRVTRLIAEAAGLHDALVRERDANAAWDGGLAIGSGQVRPTGGIEEVGAP